MAKLSTEELLDAFSELSLIELSEFVKAFEEKFEVTAAAPVAAAAAPAATQVSRSTARQAVKYSAPAASQGGKLAVDGVLGPRTARELQAWVGTFRDGVVGVQTKKALQRKVGVYADGIVGPRTVAALQTKVGISRDGASYLNARTVRALQAYLNNH